MLQKNLSSHIAGQGCINAHTPAHSFWYTEGVGLYKLDPLRAFRARVMIFPFNFCLLQLGKLFRRGIFLALPVAVCLASGSVALAQQLLWSQRMANATIKRWPDGRFVVPNAKWASNYELGILLNGMDAVWYNTADGAYYRYAKQAMDQVVAPNGSIPAYDPVANSLDNLTLGQQLLLLYRVTQDARYYKAATLLRRQLAVQPRNASGEFWHKQIDPGQMCLDKRFMAEPFYAEYASVFDEPQDFADITKRFSLIEQHTRSPKTGLLKCAWDGSRKQTWGNKIKGSANIFWAREMGWYMMALVDTLPYYPKGDPGRAMLLAILNRTAATVVRYQDKRTGLWYPILDKPEESGNYYESATACMFTYALQKGVRLGYLPQHYSQNAAHAWQGILSHFVRMDADDLVTIDGAVKAIGPGGTSYQRDSYAYSVRYPAANNDPKGVGAFLLASTEMELAPVANLARGETIMVDAWFNSQQRLNAAGQKEYFHYKWNDYSDSGFSIFGHIFASHGATLDTLYQAPTLQCLRHAQFYIIVSPDIPAKNPHPHYVQPEDAEQVAAWVKQGGVLVLMENDPANADIEHLNLIADRFGVHFNKVLSHHIIGDQFAPGQISVRGGGTLFHDSHMLYMKDTCTISLKAPATPLLTDKTGVVMATAKYGKGTVFAVVDPWLYNEYTDHRKVLPEQDNYAAGKEFVLWLLKQQQRNVRAVAQR